MVSHHSKSHTNEDLIVATSSGKLRGKIMHNKDGAKFFAFLSIPYASPPLGEFRFKAPVPAEPWEGVRDATTEAPPCYQWAPITLRAEGSEDCLYLNIYTPEVLQTYDRKK